MEVGFHYGCQFINDAHTQVIMTEPLLQIWQTLMSFAVTSALFKVRKTPFCT